MKKKKNFCKRLRIDFKMWHHLLPSGINLKRCGRCVSSTKNLKSISPSFNTQQKKEDYKKKQTKKKKKIR